MVVDIITYNGEAELLELRLNILNDYVDKFIIVEFDETFSGNKKPLYYFSQIDRFMAWRYKIKYVSYSRDTYQKYLPLAESSPNTIGAAHWKTEFAMKECLKDSLEGLEDDDLVFVGDCDEIYRKHCLEQFLTEPVKLRLRVYTYFLNNASSEIFNGTLKAKYKDIKNQCLNHLRTNSAKTITDCGWHFTSLKDGLKRKLEDSYTKETYANDAVMANLEQNIAANKDFLGRDFTYKVDESEWPEYLIKNREKYSNLLTK